MATPGAETSAPPAAVAAGSWFVHRRCRDRALRLSWPRPDRHRPDGEEARWQDRLALLPVTLAEGQTSAKGPTATVLSGILLRVTHATHVSVRFK